MATMAISQDQKTKLPAIAHLMCGWPLALVAFGGAIGGGLGGAAYAVNLAVYKSAAPTVLKVLLSLLTGAAAVVIWIVAASAIQKAMN